jgi:hypothetical protein
LLLPHQRSGEGASKRRDAFGKALGESVDETTLIDRLRTKSPPIASNPEPLRATSTENNIRAATTEIAELILVMPILQVGILEIVRIQN